jgi:hypothetical protein
MRAHWVSERSALRSGGQVDDDDAQGPPRVLRVDPGNGATGVFRDVPVVMRLSHRADAATLSVATFRVEDEDGLVPGRQWISPDRHVVVWSSDRLLSPGVPHRVTAAGIRDDKGRELLPHCSGFVPCDFAWKDLSG